MTMSHAVWSVAGALGLAAISGCNNQPFEYPADLSVFVNPGYGDVPAVAPYGSAVASGLRVGVLHVQAAGRYEDVQGADGCWRNTYVGVGQCRADRVESGEWLTRLEKLEGVRSVVRMFVWAPWETNVDAQSVLGEARRLGVDAVLIYTLGSTSEDGNWLVPLTIVTLGVAPTEYSQTHTAAEAVLIDGAGRCLARLDGRESSTHFANSWTLGTAREDARASAREAAMRTCMAGLEPRWTGVRMALGTAALTPRVVYVPAAPNWQPVVQPSWQPDRIYSGRPAPEGPGYRTAPW